MKRHPALHDLSRDHRDVLVEAKRLESGKGDAARFLRFWDAELAPHLAEEDEVLFPVLAAARNPGLDDALARAVEDHAWFRARVADVRSGAAPALGAIGARLREHVRAEERDLFPRAEAVLGDADLAHLSSRLTAHRLAARGPGAIGPDRSCAI